jgi:predicted nucleic acid-binding Zn ribbon protein
MPQYVYGDENGHRKELTLTFAQADTAIVLCDQCESIMHRIPQAAMVNWGGLPPHQTDKRPPQIQKWLKNADESRAKFLDTERKK